MPGPPPVPTALRVIRGNPRQHALPANEPMPEPVRAGKLPHSPIKLSDAERRWWRYWVRIFAACRVLTRADLMAVSGIAVLTSRWIEYRERLNQVGPVFVHTKKVKVKEKGEVKYEEVRYPIVSAFLTVEQSTWAQLERAIEQFGATPASRARVQTVGGPAEGNPFARFDKRA